MRHVVVLAVLLAALALSGAAHGGGFATVGFSPLPDGTAAGGTWRPEIIVLQHGRTPLGGLAPVITITDVGRGEHRSFTATETATTGVYRASVVFPSGGNWRVLVESGFWGEGGTVTYGPVAIEPSPPSASPRSFPVLPLALVGMLALAGATLFGVRHARRLTPASR